MNRKLLATAICAVLVSPYAVDRAYAQDTGTTDAQDQPQQTAAEQPGTDAKTLDRVTVTGSLIPQAQIENANPVITITSEDITRQGFRNVYDVLRSQPLATGTVQDNQFTNGFTPGATTISLLGLEPGFTLFLIDGRPIADYPLLYNSSGSFVDLNSIPTGMVDRIDILPGNQSSIYGSSAIAGVVNIILKKRLDGMQINARAGGYSEGGGQNQRLQFLGGKSWDKLDIVYGVQLNHQDSIEARDRDYFDSTNDNPNPNSRYGSRTFLLLRAGQGYVDPGAATCDPLSSLFGGTTTYDTRPGSGNYCGSRSEVGYGSILNKDQSASGYLNATYAINDNVELYSTTLYNYDHTVFNSGSRFWTGSIDSGGYILNNDTGTFDLFQHIFAPEETGAHTNDEHNISHSYNFVVGFRGALGQSSWDYDVYYNRSEFHIKDRQLWPLKQKINQFYEDQFLGPKLGEYYGYPIYSPDIAAFYQPTTPEQYRSFQGLIESKSKTWNQIVSATFTNSELFELPAGPVGAALLFQLGNQTWENPTDPRVIAGDFWGLTGTSGAGKRSRGAVGVEFRVPITSMLTADIANRYDKYNNTGAGSDAKATTKVGLEFRPIDSLLLRANWATAFRAPDMGYIFAGPSGFFSSATDYYRCAITQPNVPINDCTYSGAQYMGTKSGNPNLNSITATSWGYGVVWSPSSDFQIQGDYYNIDIDNEVSDLSVDQLLQTEAACRLGQLFIGSPTCVDALSRITRAGPNAPQPNALIGVRVNPINVSKEKVRGFTIASTYRLDTDRAGQFNFGLHYNRTLSHKYQQYQNDPVLELLDSPYQSSEFRDNLTATASWDIDKWSTTLFAQHLPGTYNYAAQVDPTNETRDKVSSLNLFNTSVNYDLTEDMTIGLIVNNLTNRRPPKDNTWTAWPYYNRFNYNAYGRSYYLEFNWKFGQSGK